MKFGIEKRQTSICRYLEPFRRGLSVC